LKLSKFTWVALPLDSHWNHRLIQGTYERVIIWRLLRPCAEALCKAKEGKRERERERERGSQCNKT
jgi:hypothetical protein